MHNEAAAGKTNVKTEPIDKPSDMPMNARRATGFGFYLPATEAEAPKRRETGNPFRGCNRAPPRRNPGPVDSREGSRGRAHSPNPSPTKGGRSIAWKRNTKCLLLGRATGALTQRCRVEPCLPCRAGWQDVVIRVIAGQDFGQSELYERQVRIGLVNGD